MWECCAHRGNSTRGVPSRIPSDLPANRELAKTSYHSSEQQLNLVKLLSPTNLRQGVHDEGNAYFCNSDSGLTLRFAEFNDNGDLVRPPPRNRYLRAGNYFPVLVRKRHR